MSVFRTLICTLLTAILAVGPNAHATLEAAEEQEVWVVEIPETMVTIVPESQGKTDWIEAGYLKLLGRGIQSKKTGEAIALVCIAEPKVAGGEPGCEESRFVRFNANNIPSWEGPVIKIDWTKRKLVKFFKKRIREINKKHYKEKLDKISLETRIIIGLGSAWAVALGAYYFLPSVWGTGDAFAAVLFLATLAIPAGLPVFDIINPISAKLSTPHLSVKLNATATLSQDGWNWSQNPRRIGGKKFNKLLKAIRMD